MKKFFSKFIGDKQFYKLVLAVSIPIMIQNGITNVVTLVDNVMVGQLSTEAMSGVSIVNQFIFIFNLLVFGAISAAGIFTAQYYGKGDVDGVRYTFRLKILMNVIATIIAIICFYLFKNELIGLFLHTNETSGDLTATLNFGIDYLLIMLIGLAPYSIAQAYASTMRETGDSVTPMVSSIVAVLTNCLLNAILIFGLFGLPAMGVKGAAIATVISRFVELLILVFKTHFNTEKYPFIVKAYASFKVPKTLLKQIIIKGLPLMLNEFLWALAMILRNQCYSTRGLDVVAAQNISATLFNVFNVIYMALGNAAAIIIGAELGAGEIEKAKTDADKLMAFSVIITIGIAILYAGTSLFFPYVYNTSEEVRVLARNMMLLSSINMPFVAYANSAYFTMRSGGKVAITFIFDSGFMWVIVMPLCFILSYLTSLPIIPLYFICQATEIVKAFFGASLYRKKTWAKSLVNNELQ